MCENDGLLQQQSSINNSIQANCRNNGDRTGTSLASTILQQDYLPGRCTRSEQSNRACRPSQTSSEIVSQEQQAQQQLLTSEERVSAETAGNHQQQPIISEQELIKPSGGVGVATVQVMCIQ